LRKSLQNAVAKVARFDNEIGVCPFISSSAPTLLSERSDGSVDLVGLIVSDELMNPKAVRSRAWNNSMASRVSISFSTAALRHGGDPMAGILIHVLIEVPKLLRDVSSAAVRFTRRTLLRCAAPSRKDKEVAKIESCSRSQALRPSAANRTLMNLMNAENAPISLVSAPTMKISVCDPIEMAFMKEL